MTYLWPDRCMHRAVELINTTSMHSSCRWVKSMHRITILSSLFLLVSNGDYQDTIGINRFSIFGWGKKMKVICRRGHYTRYTGQLVTAVFPFYSKIQNDCTWFCLIYEKKLPFTFNYQPPTNESLKRTSCLTISKWFTHLLLHRLFWGGLTILRFKIINNLSSALTILRNVPWNDFKISKI